MELEAFKESFFLFSNDVEYQLNSITGLAPAAEISEWLIPILAKWEEVAQPLSHKQQNVVLWRIIGNPLFIAFWLRQNSELDRDQKLALLHAAKCVTISIPNLFPMGEPMENGYFMWWDSLAKQIGELEVASICLEILSDLSNHADLRVQYSALHGLGHLRHPDKPTLVDEFIRRHPDLAGDEWVLRCREGTVM